MKGVDKSETRFELGITAFVIVILVFGGWVGSIIEEHSMRKEAIVQGHAEWYIKGSVSKFRWFDPSCCKESENQ